MFLDNSLSFTGLTTPVAISASGVAAHVYDITGAGSGNAPAMIGGFPAVNNAIGADMGLGQGEAKPCIAINVTTAGTGSGTIQFYVSGAPDNGSYSPGTYAVLAETAAFVGSTLALGDMIVIPFPQVNPQTNGLASEGLPRFYELGWTVTGTATVSVEANIALNPPSSTVAGQYPSNFVAV